MNTLIQKRLNSNRSKREVVLSMPTDVIDSLEKIAPQKGFADYQSLLQFYIGQGLREDEAKYLFNNEQLFIDALKKRGISNELLQEVYKEVHIGEVV